MTSPLSPKPQRFTSTALLPSTRRRRESRKDLYARVRGEMRAEAIWQRAWQEMILLAVEHHVFDAGLFACPLIDVTGPDLLDDFHPSTAFFSATKPIMIEALMMARAVVEGRT